MRVCQPQIANRGDRLLAGYRTTRKPVIVYSVAKKSIDLGGFKSDHREVEVDTSRTLIGSHFCRDSSASSSPVRLVGNFAASPAPETAKDAKISVSRAAPAFRIGLLFFPSLEDKDGSLLQHRSS
jgi:hypothetical protein